MNIDQPSAMVLVSLITNITMISIAIIQAIANQPPKPTPTNPGMATAPVTAITSTISNKEVARRPAWRKALFFIVWGQLNIAAAQFIEGSSPLTAWGLSFVGQGSVMLLIGFWLLLKD
ncbi:MAG: hypothetical protein ABTQ26_08765 [Azonexus sp.]